MLYLRLGPVERALDAALFSRYVALLPDDEREGARREALARAEASDDPVAAGIFLLDRGADDRATALALRLRERHGRKHGFWRRFIPRVRGREPARG